MMASTHSKHNTSTDQSSQFNYLTNSTSPQIPSDLPNLRDACKIKDVNQVMIIIKQRSDLINEAIDNFGATVLMKACKESWDDIVKYLISNHSNTININQQDKFVYSALYYAVYYGKVNCVRLLLSHPMIDVNIQYNEFNKTVLWYCSDRDCYDLLLPHYPMMKDYEKRMALLHSMYYHNRIGDAKEVMEALQEFSHDVLFEMQDDMGMLLWLASERGDEEMIEYLISSYSDVMNINIQDKHGGYTALYFTVYDFKVNCLRILLSHPTIDVNIQDNWFHKTVLWYCPNRDCYDLLLPHYPTMEDHEKRMAWLYCMYNRKIGGVKEVKEALQEFSHDVLYEMQDDMGMLLWLAADRDDHEMIEYLISSYSDVININIQDKYDGHTAVHRAVLSNRVDCLNILLNHPNIEVTIRDKKGKTAYDIGKRDPSTKTKMKVMSLLPHQKLVRWNCSKIMLVGQGRAGKTALANNLAGRWMGETASTIGAEQMDMMLFYGGVKGGRLEEYERPKQELEALLAELSYYDDYQDSNETSPKLNHIQVSRSSKDVFVDKSPLINTGLPPVDQITPRKKEKREKEYTAITSPIKLHDIKLDEVDLHYRKLQEVDTASSYKLLLVDFGGQSIFNVLHGFFMSRYGVYLVVFDMELFLSVDAAGRESCRKELKFWLNSITMHTSDSTAGTNKTASVAIVGTRGDKVRKEEDHEMISSELENLFGDMKVWKSLMWYERRGGKDKKLSFFPNNNALTKDNAVSEELLRSVEQSLGTADYMKREIPMLWIKILDEMKGLQCSYLSYEEVLQMIKGKYKNVRGRGVLAKEGDSEEATWIEIEVREILRFLNDMGMLMWIEEKGLEDVIILDPINYLVKPATTILCKHVATKDDPYRTRHVIAEIHGESKKDYGEDWMRMLEYGAASEVLVKDLLKRYYDYQGRSNKAYKNANEDEMRDKVMLLMMKYGLMVQSSAMYFIPSLLPPDPSKILVNKDSAITQNILSRLSRRKAIISSPLSQALNFSLFFHLSESKLFAHDVVSCVELQRKGFLPSGLFERLVGPFTQSLIDKVDGGDASSESLDKLFRDNKLIIGLQDKIQLVYKHHVVRLLNSLEENRIEVEMELHNEEDMSEEEKQEEREMMSRIYEDVIEIVERVLRECYSSLQVITMIPLPDNRQQTSVIGADVASVSNMSEAEVEVKAEEEGKGFIVLTRVRGLIGIADRSAAERETHELMSEDGKCGISLKAKTMKKDVYWSVWKEKVKIPTLPANSASCSSAPALTVGKKTHVFLSHDWGIDGNNHRRVRQVSEALKSRGLVTWIDEERLVNEIDEKIIDGIDHAECMLIFVTENYVTKVNGGNYKDYCKREFEYGFQVFGREKMIAVVFDEVMKDRKMWRGLISFNLGSTIYHNLSQIFEASLCLSEKDINAFIDELYDRIVNTITNPVH